MFRIVFVLFVVLILNTGFLEAQDSIPRYHEMPPEDFPEIGRQIRIPGGHFRMGSSSGEADELPEHQVWLSSFYLDAHEVTYAQYSQCTKCERGSGGFDVTNPWQPVVYVDWYNAELFCSTMGKRLPTEAEWEYAARAGSTGKYSFGESPNQLEDYAWYAGNTVALNTWYPRPVQKKQPNAWGLYDMHGNVMEWVQDHYSSDYYGVADPVYNPLGGMDAKQHDYPTRVARGGAWGGAWDRGEASSLRSSKRFAFAPWVQSYQIGFRCASSVH